MQATVINQFGGPEQLVLKDIPTPVPEHGEGLLKVQAFGINRADGIDSVLDLLCLATVFCYILGNTLLANALSLSISSVSNHCNINSSTPA